jgi:hypothetical protein
MAWVEALVVCDRRLSLHKYEHKSMSTMYDTKQKSER